jgi:transposase
MSISSRNAEILQLFKSGQTVCQIAPIFGISRQRVQQILKRWGVSALEGGQAKTQREKRATKLAEKESRCIQEWGHGLSEHASIVALQKEQNSYYRGPLGAFRTQRRNAARRGIGWQLTFVQWWKIWQESGKWEKRGRGNFGYVMARHGDEGPYAVDNVCIELSTDNVASRKNCQNRTLPRGVYETATGKFIAHRMIQGKHQYLGTFDNSLEASEAYIKSVENQG